MALIRSHTPGTIRYFTYYVMFPDGEMWVDQSPFVHDLNWQLKQTRFRNDPEKLRDLLNKGETHWKDHNGVEHRVLIEDTARPRKWGKHLSLAKRRGRS